MGIIESWICLIVGAVIGDGENKLSRLAQSSLHLAAFYIDAMLY